MRMLQVKGYVPIFHYIFVSRNIYLFGFGEKSLPTSKTDFLAYLVVDSMAFSPRGTQTTLNRLRQTFFKQFI